MVVVSVAAFAFIAVTAVVGNPIGTNDEAAIRTVLDNYLTGVDKQDMTILESAFDGEHAHMKYVSKNDAGAESITVVPIRDAFASWTKPPAKPCQGKLLNLDVVDASMAMAKYEFKWGSDMTFIDYLTLYKVNGQWKIVNKTFVRK